MSFVWGRQPQILFIDQTDQQLELSPSAYQAHPSGFRIHGFDIAGMSQPLKALRVMGLDNTGPHGGCGLGPINAYTGQPRQVTPPPELTDEPPFRQRERPSISD
jgi:hypothetical protein